MGTHGPQRDCYVALLSNMSLIHYKKGVNPSPTLKATQKLMAQIEVEIKRLKRKEQRKFSSEFENALSGKFD